MEMFGSIIINLMVSSENLREHRYICDYMPAAVAVAGMIEKQKIIS